MKLPTRITSFLPKQGVAFSKLIAACLITALGITAATTLGFYYANTIAVAKSSAQAHNHQQQEITNLQFEGLLNQSKNLVSSLSSNQELKQVIKTQSPEDIKNTLNRLLTSTQTEPLDLLVFVKNTQSSPITGGFSPYNTQPLIDRLPELLPAVGFQFINTTSSDSPSASGFAYGIEIVSGKLNKRLGYLFGIVILNDNFAILNSILQSTGADSVSLIPNQAGNFDQPIAWINNLNEAPIYKPSVSNTKDHFNRFTLSPSQIPADLSIVLWQQDSLLEEHLSLFKTTLSYVIVIVFLLVLSIVYIVTKVSSKSLAYLNQFAKAKTQDSPRIQFTPTPVFEINQVGNRLEKAVHDLAINEEMYRNILNYSGAVVYLKDLDGAYHFVNTEFECVTGINLQKALGHRDDQLFEQAQADHFISHDQQVIKENRMLTFREEMIQGNQTISFISIKFPIRNTQGDIRYICGFSTDITGIIQTQNELQREKERAENATQKLNSLNRNLADSITQKTLELEAAQASLIQSEKLASLGALVAGISHELNTPIGTSLTVASTLELKNQEFKERFENGTLTKKLMTSFIEDLTTTSQILTRSLNSAIELIGSFKQISVDQTSEHRRQFGLAQTINEVTTTHKHVLCEQNIQLIELISIDGQLDSYPGPFSQVLNNLIYNAVFHAFDEGEEGKITINARCDEGKAYIIVSDNGKGIPHDSQNKVFDPFFTTRLGHGGSGLGLHIVHTIVTGILGGSIELHSRCSGVNKGTDISITLPLTAPETNKEKEPTQ